MQTTLREDAEAIVRGAIEDNLPGQAVRQALENLLTPKGRIVLIAVGKAAWTMGKEAAEVLGDALDSGLVITKYNHVKGPIEGVRCLEAGHPVVDEASVAASKEAVRMVTGLTEDDLVLFLVSGGGSALFEDPAIPLDQLADINKQLLASGASIDEMNCVRKHLSRVKGGRFAQLCQPAHVLTIALSDVVGDRLDTIASGPTFADATTSEDALGIIERYRIRIGDEARAALIVETPDRLDNVEFMVTGSVRLLAASALRRARALGYEPHLLTCSLDAEAREAGRFLGSIVREHAGDGKASAYVCAGETVVHLTGNGLGGRNLELALAASPYLAGLDNVCVCAVGSDGTDGPTDAAGGYVDGTTTKSLRTCGRTVEEAIGSADSYHALEATGGLIVTGPTGTNVNDVAIALIRES